MKKLLVVDDELEVRKALKSSLERHSEFSVAVAKDGQEALEILEKEGIPDMVVLDLNMPGLSGEEVLKKIKAHDKWGSTPVLISTVRRESPTLMRLMEMGAADYIMKPYNIQELRRVINMYI